ncbi:MAG: aconitase X catalytic domain-containing protein [Candidatus Methanomethyliaceae archaeon]|nr:aconitase X catalytic domain-containing protein [Candidatus Methanomethyliaceae archaeon]MDW7970499.1 aconitase X catalytic domain-containing protein [Nitrososphaerota archaeon]
MYLTKEEEKMLSGEYGPALRKAMELLVGLGDVFGAEKMIAIESTQISGASYNNIGDAGMEFLEELAEIGAKAKVKSTINPCGMDLDKWREMGINEEYYEKQMRIIRAFKRMGIEISCTCTPYLVGNLPKKGSHIAWSESSAVVFANSVIGAKTNREGGPSALAAAIAGRTPYYGLHIDENRVPNIIVKLEFKPRTAFEFSLLGYTIGRIAPSGIPYFKNLGTSDVDRLKIMGAALAASGGIAMFYLNAKNLDKAEKISIDWRELNQTKENLSSDGDPDLFCIGCPHCSPQEIKELARAIKGRRVRRGCGFWIWTSRGVYEKCKEYVKIIEGAGCKVFKDTCMVVYPLQLSGYSHMACNSCKAVHYVPSTSGMKASILELNSILERGLE